MRALTYSDGRRILGPELEGGHTNRVDIPGNCNGSGVSATRISDGSVLVLVKRVVESKVVYGYEWYARGEV